MAMRHLGRLALLGLGGLTLATCATNPATGKKELSFTSESKEIQIGQENAAAVKAQMGVYDDPKVQNYVSTIGKRLASETERPNLPWDFTVMDDPVVNAFALPGGFIFITRGILTLLVTSGARSLGTIGVNTPAPSPPDPEGAHRSRR